VVELEVDPSEVDLVVVPSVVVLELDLLEVVPLVVVLEFDLLEVDP
jgi:hypothetical protein